MAELQGYAALQARLRAIGSSGSTGVMKMLGAAVVREEKLLVHRKTGTTARSIRIASTSATSVTVEAGFAAPFLEYGTKAHEITPSAEKALRWATSSAKGFRLSGRPSSAKGNAVGYAFATVVHHPGTKAYPFMVPGAKVAVEKSGADSIVAAWNGAA